jgi:uncharacterized integral membrane protein
MARKSKRAPATGDKAPQYVGTGVWPAVVASLVVGLAVIIFVAQNAHATPLEFLWFDFRTSPAVLVLATAFLSIAGAVTVGAAVRVRRRRILKERQELARLRQVASEPPSTTGPTPPPPEPPSSPPPPPASTGPQQTPPRLRQ